MEALGIYILGVASGVLMCVPYALWKYRDLINTLTEGGPGVSITPDGRYAVVDLEARS